jgi:acyl-coenzyme A thioesterase PaaI-like protein
MSGFDRGFSARLDHMSALNESNLFLRAFIVLTLIGFAFFIAIERGLVQLALDSDKSYISYVILAIYLAASAHWLYLTRALSVERTRFAEMEEALAAGASLAEVGSRTTGGLLGDFLGNLQRKRTSGDAGVLVTAFGDEIANRHALGYFTSDVLLRLGLLGTIVGFIFMLMPIADMDGFDASMMQQLLRSMSGGMAVALYTTLAGLVTSTLLKLQYHLVDASAAALVTRLTIVVDTHLEGTRIADGSDTARSG